MVINYPIHSTQRKIILSTQPCPFSTCQLNPRFLLAASTPKQKNPRVGKELPTLGNALFSSLFGIQFCTFDSKTTVSTWLDTIG